MRRAAHVGLQKLARSGQLGGLGVKLQDVIRGSSYKSWIKRNETPPAEGNRAERLAPSTHRPRFSIIVAVFNTPPPYLEAMIGSVLCQTFPSWELCVADDASTTEGVREMLRSHAAEDDRIKVTLRSENGHISAATNTALSLASGEWIVMLDHDDMLACTALASVAKTINKYPDIDFIYSDEDKIDDSGRRYDPFFKPDFSPDLLRSQNYINHLSVFRREDIERVGGWRMGFEGSQDFDLLLRVLEQKKPSAIYHIPEVLYHWRAAAGSTARNLSAKGYAVRAGLRALQDHLKRTHANAEAEQLPLLPFFRVRYALPKLAPLASLIIPTRDQVDLLANCVSSILSRTSYDQYEIVIVDNDSRDERTHAYLNRITENAKVRVVKFAGEFNYSEVNNFGVSSCSGHIIALINNDLEVISSDWLTEMTSWAYQNRIGCVGAKLYYPNNTVQHAGVVLGIGGIAGHSHKHVTRGHPGYFSRLSLVHNISAVTGACLVTRRSVYDEVGGLDPGLAVAFNDVDFCLRVQDKGYTNILTPFAELYHHESASRGYENSAGKVGRFNQEVNFMRKRWGERLQSDPFYSPHLTRIRDDYSLAP